MPTDLQIAPFLEAVERLSGRTPIGSRLRSREWSRVPLELRERAFFSAGVEKVETLDLLQGKLRQALTLDPGDVFIDKATFVLDMRNALGATGLPDTQQLTDLTSSTRLELIYEHNVEDAFSHGRWKMGQDPELLDEFPAQEFLRVEARRVPRTTWRSRWSEAGGRTFNGRMIAAKNDPVWTKLSAFGKPWPPFDFGSGMGVQDIDREEAEALGVIAPGETIEPEDASFNKNLEASVSDIRLETRELLRKHFGDQISLEGDTVKWKEAV